MTDTLRLAAAEFPAQFRVRFRHASATRQATENVICHMASGPHQGFGEGCPRPYVTGETAASARAWISAHGPAFVAEVGQHGLEGLISWVDAHRSEIDMAPAAFCALELAALDLLGRCADAPVEELLGRAPLSGVFRYSAVLGDSGPVVFNALLARYLARGFRDVKIKLSGDLRRDRSKVRWLRPMLRRSGLRHGGLGLRLRADANNLWANPGACIDHLRALDVAWYGIEEPLSAGDIDGFAEVSEALGAKIILDESARYAHELESLPGPPERWVLNCRVSKMGGLLRSLEAVEAAAGAGVGVIVGAHVGETSILTRAALAVASAAGSALAAQEGAFGTNLLAQDLTEPCLMFDRAGHLTAGAEVAPDCPGLGLSICADRLRSVEPVSGAGGTLPARPA